MSNGSIDGIISEDKLGLDLIYLQLIYLLQGFDSKNYTYDKQFDVFIIGDDSLQSRVCAYIESLPDIIHVRDIPKILEQALDEENIPHDVLRVALTDAYKTTGDVYHRVRLGASDQTGNHSKEVQARYSHYHHIDNCFFQNRSILRSSANFQTNPRVTSFHD